jgi:all-beta uncharacterized protein
VERAFAIWSVILLLACGIACGGATELEVAGPGNTTRCLMSLTVPPPLPAGGTQVETSLSTERDCTWAVHTSDSWLAISPEAGQGDARLTLIARANPQGRTRSATIDVNDQHFTVVQSGQPCRYDVAPTSVAVPHQGGRIAIRLTTLDGCTWTTQASQPWLRVVVGSGGEASATLDVAVDSNSGPERSAVLSVAALIVAVHQGAGPDDRSECQYSIDPGASTIPAAGGNSSFRVATLTQCAWGAVANQPWVRVISANGMGPGEVQYRVDANTSASNRSATITVGTRRHVVTQQRP